MKDMNIEDIHVLCGPLWGDCMRQLLSLMREQHGYEGSPIPSHFARAVIETLPGGASLPSTAQCPELFAAQALKAMGVDLDDDDIEQSRRFQQRREFHFGR